MRKGVMIGSFVSFMFLSAGLIIRVLTNPMNLVWPALPWLLSSLLITVGFMVMVAALILYIIYWYRQERAKEQQFKRWGMVVRTNQDLLRCKVEKARPYKREVWLQLALFVSLGLVLLSTPVMGLILPQVVPPPSGPYTSENYRKQQDYQENFPRIEATFDLIFWPGAPVSILICTFLSKDLAKKSET